MKIFLGLLPLLAFWIPSAICQCNQELISVRKTFDGEFEGSGESSLGGGDRLVPYNSDTCLSGTNFIGYCPRINLPGNGIVFKGQQYTKIHICNNGMLRFEDGTYQNWPRNFGLQNGRQEYDPCLAPYWARVDEASFQNGCSKVCYKKHENPNDDIHNVFSTAEKYGKQVLSDNSFTPKWVMVVTWKDVRPLDPGEFGGLNTFQVLLAANNKYSFAVYIYADMDWSVRALKRDQGNFLGDFPPVVGWNAGERNGLYREDEEYDNFKHSGNVRIEEIDDEQDTKISERGKFGFKLGEKDEARLRCQNWYDEERFFLTPSCIPCPPTFWHATLFSRNFQYEFPVPFPELQSEQICFINRFSPWWNPIATRCCYRNRGIGTLIRRRGRLSGSSLAFHPRFFPLEYQKEIEAKENCCIKSDVCNYYYSVRRFCDSRFWRRPWWSWGAGDPHFKTLDGKNYTFNGCGWYTYFQGNVSNIGNSSLEVQVRTTKVGDANATAFTGIALKEGTSETVQVNLRSTGGLLILIDGGEYSGTVTTNVTTLDGGVSLQITDGGTLSISTPLGNEARITETANSTFLTIITSFIEDYTNSSKGLSGYWNGNADDDFLLPNGTILPSNISDSQIHYDFGENWAVKEKDKIYVNVSDDANFKCPTTFVPIFLDALQFGNDSLKEEADAICGNDVNCLFDIAATGNTAIGESTLNQITTINNEIEQLENNVPYFTVNETQLNVTLGETFSLNLTASDGDGDSLTFGIVDPPEGANFTSSGNIMSFTWLVNSTEQVNFTFTVDDGKNGTDSLIPDITLCACQNGGDCFIPETTNEVISEFLDMECNCPLGKTGRYCESQRDFCASAAGTVCHPLVSCFNHPTNFSCGPCPTGYDGNGHVCAEIDECSSDEKNNCEQLCSNTAGSFLCQCNPGFTLDNRGSKCNDIDECSQPNDCAQECNNTIGSYECFCRLGFKINPNNTKECVATDLCVGNNQCTQICYMDPISGEAKCACNSGYVLDANGNTCKDVDECASPETNLCEQDCINTVGSYNCSCNTGYSQSGRYACSDDNECLTDNNCNQLGEYCENLAGSYRCKCFVEWNLIRINGSCVYKSDPNAQADLAPEPPIPSAAAKDSRIRVKILNFQQGNWTVDQDSLFRESVVKLVNEYCNENRFRPQDCGSSQNQLIFNLLHVQRLPGFPKDDGSDALLEFYINYPNGSTAEVIPQAVLASIIFSQLGKLENETKLDLVLETSVTPDPPKNSTADEERNAVVLDILNFENNQWTTFYDVVFRRAVAVTLNTYCNQDAYAPAECLVAGSQVSFNQTHIGRLPDYPKQNGSNVLTSFYVNYPNGTGPMPKIVLASILTTAHATLVTSLGQQVTLLISAAPDAPPNPSSDETNNSVVVEIASFQADEWTYLDELRFRKIVATRINSYCSPSNTTLMDCGITSNQASFSLSDVQRTTTGSPSQNGNNADLSFYVNYPGGSRPMEQRILASVIKAELDVIKQESRLALTLQTPAAPLDLSTPTNQQSSNTVALEILNIQADEWTAIQDNRLRKAVADALAIYCGRNSKNLLACNITSDQTSFELSHVTRISPSPSQNDNNATYNLFANYPSGSGPVPSNILAGILSSQLATINDATGLQLLVKTSSAADSPPEETSSQNEETVVVVASNLEADQWSAIQDNIFRGSVAQVITEYCNVNDARREECGITGGATTFTLLHVQRVQNSPSQNGSDAELKFYASYPNGGIVRQEVLSLIIQAQLELLENKTGLELTLRTTFVPPTVIPPTTLQNESSIEVLLYNFGVDEWTLHRDNLFREKMANALITFCNASSFHLDLCNISQSKLLSFNASHIQRLPNSPTQSGSNAVLAFYADLPSGGGTVARNILSSAFVSRQEDFIFLSRSISVITSPLPETPNVTQEQERNSVPITVYKFSRDKFTSLQEMDIKITVVNRMNAYCFSVVFNQQGCFQSARRRKRAVTNQTQFTTNDVQIIQSSITASGNNTKLSVSVTQPGSSNPVSSIVVQDALQQSFQQNGLSDGTGLLLGLTIIPTPTTTETGNSIEVVLNNFNVNQWLISTELSFRQNMTAAVIQFCNSSSDHLSLCNISREDLARLTYLNIEILSNSPSQNESDALLSFYVDLPGGSGTLPKDVLEAILSTEKNNILSQPFTITTTSPFDSGSTSDQFVQLTIRDFTPDPFVSVYADDIKESIAIKLNEYCKDKSSIVPCSHGNFDTDDVILTGQKISNVSDTLVTFYVKSPGQTTSVSADIIRNILSPGFTTKLKLTINVDASSLTASTKSDNIDLPLILGLSIVGASIFIFVILAIGLSSYKSMGHPTKFRQDRYKYRDDHFDLRSMHSSRGGWEFDRASPYSGSPFASIDAIPGFDEDGLPYETTAVNTQIY